MHFPSLLLALAALSGLSQPAAIRTTQRPAAATTPAARSTAPVPHQRLLPLQGGRNFRDLGGYRTRQGHRVKWGVLFRSGAMSGLTLSDYAYLEKLGIRVVCDFRDPSERANERVAWPSPGAPRLLADDYDLAKAGIIPDPVTLEHATADEARRKIAASYPRILKAFNGQYRRMFRELLAGHAPLAFNCTAGKDRTGVAAALLLIALDVPRETVVQDYLLTNRYLDQRAVAAKQDPRSASNQWMRLPAAVLTALGAADRSYIGAVFSVFDRHPGGANGYFRSELGLSRSDIGRLRHMYLE